MAGGTHNKDARLALEVFNNSLGKTKKCGCPLHLRNGVKGEIDASLFNRQSKSKDGLQNLCADGKKLIDRLKHKINGVKLAYVFDRMTGSDTLSTLRSKFANPLSDSILDKFLGAVGQACPENAELTDSEHFSWLMAEIDFIVGDRSNSIQKRIGIYSVGLDKKNFQSIIDDFTLEDRLDKDQKASIFQHHDDMCDAIGAYIKDSKDNEVDDHNGFRTDWGKIREALDEDGNEILYGGKKVRVNKFNTKYNAGGDARTLKLFPDGDWKAADREMRRINNIGLSADHVWPVSLGGRHDVENLVPMQLSDNIKKRNNLTLELVEEVAKNPAKHISERYLDTFVEITRDGIDGRTVAMLEKSMLHRVHEWVGSIKGLEPEQKKTAILELMAQKGRGHRLAERAIRKFFN